MRGEDISNQYKFLFQTRAAYFLHPRIPNSRKDFVGEKNIFQASDLFQMWFKQFEWKCKLSINQYESTCRFDGCQQECGRAPVFANFSTFLTTFFSLSTRFSPSFCFYLVNLASPFHPCLFCSPLNAAHALKCSNVQILRFQTINFLFCAVQCNSTTSVFNKFSFSFSNRMCVIVYLLVDVPNSLVCICVFVNCAFLYLWICTVCPESKLLVGSIKVKEL